MSATYRIKGLKELGQALDALPKKIGQNIMRSGLAAGGRIVRDEAKANVRVDSGKLRDGIKVRTRYRNGVATATVYVTGEHAFVGPWLEYGTSAHKIMPKKGTILSFAGVRIGRAVEHPGSAPKPFMRPAMDKRAAAAVVAVGNQIKKRFTKAGIETPDVDIEEE